LDLASSLLGKGIGGRCQRHKRDQNG